MSCQLMELRRQPSVGYMSVSVVFVYLSDGSPPAEDRAWPWRLGRGLARWGSLALALICFVEAENRVSGRSVSLDGIAPHLLMKMGVFIAGFIALSFYLSAMFQREQVKRELADRGCQARRIWWLPAAYWVPWASFWGATGFRVSLCGPGGCDSSRVLFRLSFIFEEKYGEIGASDG